jgi:hypothetical protein
MIPAAQVDFDLDYLPYVLATVLSVDLGPGLAQQRLGSPD